MNAPARIPLYSRAQILAQEQAQYEINRARLDKLFARTAQRDEWRADFDAALCDFIADREGELDRAVEFDAPLSGEYRYQRSFDVVRL